MARLSGRTAIVTGGAKGIGRHYSLALAAEGARVMIADISDGTELTQEIAAKHGANSVTSAIADVSDESSVKSLVAAAMERFGRIDVLVNNAALFAPLQETKCTEIDADLWDQVMAVKFHHRPDPGGGRRQCKHLRRPPAARKIRVFRAFRREIVSLYTNCLFLDYSNLDDPESTKGERDGERDRNPPGPDQGPRPQAQY